MCQESYLASFLISSSPFLLFALTSAASGLEHKRTNRLAEHSCIQSVFYSHSNRQVPVPVCVFPLHAPTVPGPCPGYPFSISRIFPYPLDEALRRTAFPGPRTCYLAAPTPISSHSRLSYLCPSRLRDSPWSHPPTDEVIVVCLW